MADYRDEKRTIARTFAILGWTLPRGYNPKTKIIGDPARQAAAMLNKHFGLPDAGVTRHLILECRAFNQAWALDQTAGARAVAYLTEHVGPQEVWGRNAGPLLQQWSTLLQQAWMIAGRNPWCGQAVQAAFRFGAGVDLAKAFPGVSWVYTPSIAQAIETNRDGYGWRLVEVPWVDRKLGDVIVFDWSRSGLDGPPMAADHVGLVRSSAGGAVALTIEGNTPRGGAGDQSGLGAGDGIWQRERPISDVLRIGRLVPTR